MGMALIITDRSCDELYAALKILEPRLNIQVWPNIEDPEAVTFAVLWKQPKGILKTFSNLKAVTSLGAGIDFIACDSDLPKNIPVHRIVTVGLKQQMAQYVLCYILSDFRQVEKYRQQQLAKNWQINKLPNKSTIGFLGLGKIGGFVALQCQSLGFQVIAYTHKTNHKDINCFHSEAGIKQVMQKSDYIVCLLPLTKLTKGTLNFKRFSYCKKQPVLIHVGRGEQLIESDLLKALDKGILKHAVLDVFATEPLPKNNPLWQRKDVTITPHNAARSDVEQTTKEILSYYRLEKKNQ